ncbi:BRO-N domain-containing protein [Sodalis sp. (in: enterobacteria)]|uniref:BRO-N domain-containing protein n=1 Tax=Sodalis sp. (in: enterobacteria) TaxID=1898979 RepID=UPI003F3779A3
MSALVIKPIAFSFHETHDVRIQVIDGGPWFCLKDVCEVLTIANPRRVAAEILDAKGVRKTDTLTNGGQQQTAFINEPNLYRVIFRSNKPEAKQFQDWVGFVE